MKQFAFFFFLLDRKLIDLPSFNQRRICFEAELYFSKVRLPPTSGCLLPLECSLTEFPIGHLTWSPGLFAQLLVNTSLCFFNSASFFFFLPPTSFTFRIQQLRGKQIVYWDSSTWVNIFLHFTPGVHQKFCMFPLPSRAALCLSWAPFFAS